MVYNFYYAIYFVIQNNHQRFVWNNVIRGEQTERLLFDTNGCDDSRAALDISVSIVRERIIVKLKLLSLQR